MQYVRVSPAVGDRLGDEEGSRRPCRDWHQVKDHDFTRGKTAEKQHQKTKMMRINANSITYL